MAAINLFCTPAEFKPRDTLNARWLPVEVDGCPRCVIEENGVEVGYAVVLKGGTVRGYWQIGSIGVAEAALGRKYGSALLSFATAHIHAQDQNAMITVDSENAAMIAAATHQGYKSK